MKITIIILICCVVYEAISLVYMYKKFQAKLKTDPMISMTAGPIIGMVKGFFKKLSIVKICIIIPMLSVLFIIASPFLVILSFWGLLKKVLGIKTKKDKEVDAQSAVLKKAQQYSELFMKTEGRTVTSSTRSISNINHEDYENIKPPDIEMPPSDFK